MRRLYGVLDAPEGLADRFEQPDEQCPGEDDAEYVLRMSGSKRAQLTRWMRLGVQQFEELDVADVSDELRETFWLAGRLQRERQRECARKRRAKSA